MANYTLKINMLQNIYFCYKIIFVRENYPGLKIKK